MNFGLSGAFVDTLGFKSETPLYLNPQNCVNTIFVKKNWRAEDCPPYQVGTWSR